MYNTDIPTRAELPTNAQLLRSTAIAIVAAAGILVTIVLPAEYAIDPTGVGRMLRLTEMGEIKTQLADEAERDRQLDQSQPASLDQGAGAATGTTPVEGSSLLDRIIHEFGVASAHAQEAMRQDEMSITLQPGEGAEIKLVMIKGAKANYWGQNKSCSKSYAKTERSGNVMQRGGFFQEVAMA